MSASPPPMTERPLPDLPRQADGIPWPTSRWPRADASDLGADVARLTALLDVLVADQPHPTMGRTFAAAVVCQGQLVTERYGLRPVRDLRALEPDPPLDRLDESSELLSWSMAKSLTHLAVGVAVADGLIDHHERVPEPRWADPSDPRHDITWDDLLTMRGGLAWREEYVIDTDRLPDVVEMLFASGADDTAGFAAGFELAHPPGSPEAYVYSSGTTNVIVANLQRVLGMSGDVEGFTRWLHHHILDPIGMTDTRLEFDEAGTFVGSSYAHCTLQSWCRFGLLALRGGFWDGRQIVPAEWIDHGRTPRSNDKGIFHGAHWWSWDQDQMPFGAHGFEGQRVICFPTRDLVVVRLGQNSNSDEASDTLSAYLTGIAACFPVTAA